MTDGRRLTGQKKKGSGGKTRPRHPRIDVSGLPYTDPLRIAWYKFRYSLRHYGLSYTALTLRRKLRAFLRAALYGQSLGRRGAAALGLRLSPRERSLQEQTAFAKPVKFSILVPLYNTPEEFLRAMIESVQAQTYGNWELCLADGSDGLHARVGEICAQYRQADGRVRYEKLAENRGISENTNACLAMAEGDYISLLDHDDCLHPSALWEVMRALDGTDADLLYTDEATFAQKTGRIVQVHYKPDFAIDNLRANNYICHFLTVSRELFRQTGGFRSEYDGSQDHDMVLRLTERARRIVHIPRVLYLWRSHPGSTAAGTGAKSYAAAAGCRAVGDHLKRVGLPGEVSSTELLPTIYRVRYELRERPKVSVVIPTRDQLPALQRCVGSLLEKTTYPDFEIVLVDNGSREPGVLAWYGELEKQGTVRVVRDGGDFNFSRLVNAGAAAATGKYLLFLNNDTEVVTPDWIEQMLMFAQREDVGAVGAMLLYPDGTVQHAGIILGMGEDRIAGHIFCGFDKDSDGYMGRLGYAQDLSAVTAACLLVSREAFGAAGGFDTGLPVAYNDVDFCLRLRRAGYLNVYTPFAKLLHYESLSRGGEDTPEARRRFQEACARFRERWADELARGDPYYNPNLSLDGPECAPVWAED